MKLNECSPSEKAKTLHKNKFIPQLESDSGCSTVQQHRQNHSQMGKDHSSSTSAALPLTTIPFA